MGSVTWRIGAALVLVALSCKKPDSTPSQAARKDTALPQAAGQGADANEACADPKMKAEVEQRKKEAELKAQSEKDVLAPIAELRALVATALETGAAAELPKKALPFFQRIDDVRTKASFPPVGEFLSRALFDALRFAVTCQAAATATPQACDALLPTNAESALNCRRETVFLRLITRDMIATRSCDTARAERAAQGLHREVGSSAILGFCNAVVRRDPEACKANKDNPLIYDTCRSAAAGKTLACTDTDPQRREQCQKEATRFAAASSGLVAPPEGSPMGDDDQTLLAATAGPGNAEVCRSRGLALYDKLMEPARKFQNP
jgi:hypothetical protein